MDHPDIHLYASHFDFPLLQTRNRNPPGFTLGAWLFVYPSKEAVSSRSMHWPSERGTRVKSIEGSVVRVAWVLHAPEGISKLWPRCSKFGHRLWYRDLAPLLSGYQCTLASALTSAEIARFGLCAIPGMQ